MPIPNPLASGFRAVLRDPKLLLIEVAWRWLFGLTAGALLLFGWHHAAGTVPLSRVDHNALASHDAFRMAQAALNILTAIGRQPAKLAAVVLLAVSLLWIFLAALGRTLTMRGLVNLFGLFTEGPGGVAIRQISLRAMLALHFWRILLAWPALAAMVAGVLYASRVANRGPQPDYFMYYAVAIPMMAGAAIFWLIVNWYLSAAAAWVGRQGAGAVMATRMTIGFASARKGDMGGLNAMFILIRFGALLVAFVLCVLPAGLVSSAGYTFWVISISLLYFVFADLVCLARLASYLMIEEETPAEAEA